MDFYLDDKYAAERAQIVKLSKQTDATSAELLRGYVREAMSTSFRFTNIFPLALSYSLITGLNPQFAGLFRAVAEDDVIPQGDGLAPLKVNKGDLLFASFKNAHLNVSSFS